MEQGTSQGLTFYQCKVCKKPDTEIKVVYNGMVFCCIECQLAYQKSHGDSNMFISKVDVDRRGQECHHTLDEPPKTKKERKRVTNPHKEICERFDFLC